MMHQRMDVREDRLTHQMKDEWRLMVGSSGTLTYKQTDRQEQTLHKQVLQKYNYPVTFTCDDCWPKNVVDVL